MFDSDVGTGIVVGGIICNFIGIGGTDSYGIVVVGAVVPGIAVIGVVDQYYTGNLPLHSWKLKVMGYHQRCCSTYNACLEIPQ